MKISVIDLGFNSLKLISYDVNQDNSNSFAVFDQKSVHARLGDGLNRTGFLGDEPIHRAIEGLRFFREVNEFNEIKQCLPVATSAVREAANREQFMKQVFSETGFKFRILSGREEALYSYTGAVRSLGQSNVLFFDIGGGSLEFVYSRDSKIRKIMSLPLGGLRLTQLYSEPDGTFKEKSYARMKERVQELLPSRRELAVSDDTTLVGVGGNLRALARWDQETRDYPLNKVHNYQIKGESIELMSKELSKLSSKEIGDIRAIGRDRAGTLAAGALVIEHTMKMLGFRKVVVSTHGLRDGILSSFLDDPVAYHRGNIGKTLRKTLNPRMERVLPRRIEHFVEMLETYDLLERKEAEILAYELKWLVSGIPEVRPDAFFYLVMDDEPPLSHREQLIAALALVKFRKPKAADWLYFRYKSMLKPKKSKDIIEKTAAVSRFLDIIIRTDSKIGFSIVDRGSKMKFRITTPKQVHQFPESLLKGTVAELANKLDRFVEYSLGGASAVQKTEREVRA